MTNAWYSKMLPQSHVADYVSKRMSKLTPDEERGFWKSVEGMSANEYQQNYPFALLNIYHKRLARLPADLRQSIMNDDIFDDIASATYENPIDPLSPKPVAFDAENKAAYQAWTTEPPRSSLMKLYDNARSGLTNYFIKFGSENPEFMAVADIPAAFWSWIGKPFTDIPSQALTGNPLDQNWLQIRRAMQNRQSDMPVFGLKSKDIELSDDALRTRFDVGAITGLGTQIYIMGTSGIAKALATGSKPAQIAKVGGLNLAYGIAARSGMTLSDPSYIFRYKPEWSKGNPIADIKQYGAPAAMDWMNTMSFDLTLGAIDAGIIGLTATRASADTGFRQMVNSGVGTANVPSHMKLWYKMWGYPVYAYQKLFYRDTSMANTMIRAQHEMNYLIEGKTEDMLRATKNIESMVANAPSSVRLPDGSTIEGYKNVRRFVDESTEKYLTGVDDMDGGKYRNILEIVYGNREVKISTPDGKQKSTLLHRYIADQMTGIKTRIQREGIAMSEADLFDNVNRMNESVKALSEKYVAEPYLAELYKPDTEITKFLKWVVRGKGKKALDGVAYDPSRTMLRRNKYVIEANKSPNHPDKIITNTFPDSPVGRAQAENALKYYTGTDHYGTYTADMYEWKVSMDMDSPYDNATVLRNAHAKVKAVQRLAKNEVRSAAEDELFAEFDTAIESEIERIKLSKSGAVTRQKKPLYKEGKAELIGDYAVYKDPTKEYQGYVVQHIPSGVILKSGYHSPKQAHRFIAALERIRGEEPLMSAKNEAAGSSYPFRDFDEAVQTTTWNRRFDEPEDLIDIKGIDVERTRELVQGADDYLENALSELYIDDDAVNNLFREKFAVLLSKDKSVQQLVDYMPDYLNGVINGGGFRDVDLQNFDPPAFFIEADTITGEGGTTGVKLTLDNSINWWDFVPKGKGVTVEHANPLYLKADVASSTEMPRVTQKFNTAKEAKAFMDNTGKLNVREMGFKKIDPLTAEQKAELNPVTDPIEKIQRTYYDMVKGTATLNMFKWLKENAREVFDHAPTPDEIARAFGISNDLSGELATAQQVFDDIVASGIDVSSAEYKQAFNSLKVAKRNYRAAENIEYRQLPKAERRPISPKGKDIKDLTDAEIENLPGEIVYSSKDTAKARSFGTLEGHYVPKAWDEDFNSMDISFDDMQSVVGYVGKFSEWLTRRLKKNFVIWSPTTHINQFFGNGAYSTKAGNSIFNPVNKKWYDGAAKGIFDSDDDFIWLYSRAGLEDFTRGELGLRTRGGKYSFDEFLDNFTGKSNKTPAWVDRLKKIIPDEIQGKSSIEKLTYVLGRMQETAGDAENALSFGYQFSDNFYKLAMFKKAIAPVAEGGFGWTKDAALEHVMKFYPNYSRFNRFVRGARNIPVVNMFLSFIIEDIRIRLNGMREYPIRTIMTDIMFPLATSAASGIAAGMTLDELYKVDENKPMWRKGNAFASVLMKVNGNTWNWNYLPYLPNTDMFTDNPADITKSKTEQFVTSKAFGAVFNAPVLAPLFGIQTNVDPFTRREVTSKGVSSGYNALETALYLHNAWAPRVLQTYRYLGMADAISGKIIKEQKVDFKDRDGNVKHFKWNVTRDPIPTYLKNTIGVRLERVEPMKEALVKYNTIKYNRRELKADLNKMISRGENGDWVYNDLTDEYELPEGAKRKGTIKFRQVKDSYENLAGLIADTQDYVYTLLLEGYEYPEEEVK